MSEDYAVETQCQSCLFCKPTDTLWSCKLGIAEILESHGCKRIVDNDKFKIEGRACWYYRNDIWKTAKSLHTFEQQKQAVMSEVHLKYDLIVYVGQNNEFDEITQTIQSAEWLTITPQQIIIAIHKKVSPIKILHWCRQNINIPWSIEVISLDLDIDSALNVVYRKCKSIYILVYEAGNIISNSKLNTLNTMICKNLNQIIMSIPEDGGINGLFFLRLFGKQAGWNLEDNITNKANRIAKKQDKQNMVITDV